MKVVSEFLVLIECRNENIRCRWAGFKGRG
jgi:hypothetical protein